MSDVTTSSEDGLLSVGTLHYTKKTLAILFFWLIWGDVIFMLMEGVVPSILPIYFERIGASNTTIALIMVTIPMLMTAVINPIVSFRSDRFRSKLGRRIPFIIYTLPFLVLTLVGLGFTNEITLLVQHILGPRLHMSQHWAAIWTIGFLMVAFTYFNSFVGAVFWYLFNDVVPGKLLARFMSLFRLFSMLTTSGYNFFIFKYAGHYSKEIFIGAGLAYLFGFSVMCFNVKEGDYGPPPALVGRKADIFASVRTFFVECLSIPHYWYIFAATMLANISIATNTFAFFFYRSTNLNLAQIGDVVGVANISIAVLIPFSGWLADRYHPIRIVIVGYIISMCITLPATMVFLFWHPPSNVAFWAWIIIVGPLTGPMMALTGVFDPPMFMVVFPRSRYGQFCSANAMLRAIAGICGGILAGGFLDFAGHFMPHKDVYRLAPVWTFIFTIPIFICMIALYKSWNRYGGDDHYIPPVPGETIPLVGEEAIPDLVNALPPV